MKRPIDFNKAQKDPSCEFNSPDEIASNPDLTKSQKLKLLRIWKQDAILMQEAAAEDMAGGEDDRLQEVHKAIDKVGLSRD